MTFRTQKVKVNLGMTFTVHFLLLRMKDRDLTYLKQNTQAEHFRYCWAFVKLM